MPYIRLAVRAAPRRDPTARQQLQQSVSTKHCQDAPYAHWRQCLSDLCTARRYTFSVSYEGPCDACRRVGPLVFVVTGKAGTSTEGERSAWCSHCAQVPFPF